VRIMLCARVYARVCARLHARAQVSCLDYYLEQVIKMSTHGVQLGVNCLEA